MNPSASESLVLGASSQVGWFVLPRLLAAGFRVTAVSREPAPPAYPELDRLQWTTPDEVRPRLGAYSQLVSAAPLSLALDYAQAMPALQMLAVTSSSSVVSKANSPDEAEQRVSETLRGAEEGLGRLARQRRLPLLILRPTLIYGCGMDRNLTRIASLIQRFGVVPLSTRAGGLRQPIHADDVAQALVAGLVAREPRELISPLCGGDTVDYRGMVRRVFTALGRPPRLLALPPGLLAALLSLLGRLPGGFEASAEMVHRQAVNLVFDDRPAREVLGVRPRRFHPDAGAFRAPDAEQLRRLSEG
ncbi:MAG: hypothetical protein AAGH19_04935 [Pseudomonadota bacterium]